MSKPGESVTGDSTLDHFSHYSYAPSRTLNNAIGLGTPNAAADNIQGMATMVGNIFSVTSAGVLSTTLPPGYVTNGVPGDRPISAISNGAYARATNTFNYNGSLATVGGINGQLPVVEADSRF